METVCLFYLVRWANRDCPADTTREREENVREYRSVVAQCERTPVPFSTVIPHLRTIRKVKRPEL